MEGSTLIAGKIACRARMVPHLNTIGDQTQAPLQFSSHHTPATTHQLHPPPSTPPLVRVLVAGKTARDRPLVDRTAPTPHNPQDQRILRRGRVTTHPDLHLQSTSDPTIDTLLPLLQRHPLLPDQMGFHHPQTQPRITQIPLHPRLRPHGPLSLHRCLRETTP